MVCVSVSLILPRTTTLYEPNFLSEAENKENHNEIEIKLHFPRKLSQILQVILLFSFFMNSVCLELFAGLENAQLL